MTNSFDIRPCAQDNTRVYNAEVEFERRQTREVSNTRNNNPIIKINVSNNAACNRAVRNATSQIGVKEATGNNDGAQIRKYQYNSSALKNQPWCASFVNWCYNPNHQAGKNILGMSDKDVPSTQKILARAKNLGCFQSSTSGYQPRVGDLLIWTNDQDKGKGHTAIVIEVRSDGSFVTVHGNNENQVQRIEYRSVRSAMRRKSTSSGVTQTLSGFVQISKYNNSHHIASTFQPEGEDESNTLSFFA